MDKVEYKPGEHITTKDGKLVIANDKKRLIKLAEKELKEWIEVYEKAKQEVSKWIKFMEKLKEKK